MGYQHRGYSEEGTKAPLPSPEAGLSCSLRNFFSSSIDLIWRACCPRLSNFYNSLSAKDKNCLNRVLYTCSKVIGRPQNDLHTMFKRQTLLKVSVILRDDRCIVLKEFH